MKIETSFVDMRDLDILRKSIKPNTKMVFIETPTNPLLRMFDIKAVSEIVHSVNKDIILVVDNTFLTPYFMNPLDLGADIAMYSLSKYINGHSDVVMGAVTINDESIYKRVKALQKCAGIIPSPFDCYLVNRSLHTLELRMMRHFQSGLAVAKFLEDHPAVEKVYIFENTIII